MALLRPELAYLPLAQTIWYVPTGLDPWNQLLGKMPGHYVRLYELQVRGQAAAARGALGRAGAARHRRHLPGAAQRLADAGPARRGRERLPRLPRPVGGGGRDGAASCWPSSPSPGSSTCRTGCCTTAPTRRATSRTAPAPRSSSPEAVGWENAHTILYAGVPGHRGRPALVLDLRDGLPGRAEPRWTAAIASSSATTTPCSAVESLALVEALLSGEEPAYIHLIVALLKAGKGLRQIIDTIQVASAQLILETGDPNNYSMPQHSYEYCNTVRWFFDTFEHPHRLKLLFVAAAFVCRAAHYQRAHGRERPGQDRGARAAPTRMPQHQLLERLDDALMGLRAVRGRQLDRGLPQGRLRPRAARRHPRHAPPPRPATIPHNQELGPCLLEDYAHTHGARPRPPAARLRQAHRRPPEVRRPPGGVPPVRRSVRPRRPPIRAHLLRWRPRPQAQRSRATPRLRPSGAASHLDPSRRPAALAGDIG